MREIANTLQPIHQNVWRLPAVLNFTLGGVGSGIYLVGTFLSCFQEFSTSTNLFYIVSAPLLIILGLFAVSQEAGRPSRAIYLMRNWKQSWMSRETLAAAIFIPSCFLEVIFSSIFFSLVGFISGLIFLISQGMIMYKSRGLPAWNIWLTPVLFVVSGFVAGSGLLLCFLTFSGNTSPYLAFTTLGFLLLDIILWYAYVNYTQDPAFRLATRHLRKAKYRFTIPIVGHALPALVIVVEIYRMLFHPEFLTGITSYLAAFAALIPMYTAYKIRYGIVIKAGFYRKITLYRKPEALSVKV
ncbi:DmsC/YnfH family molybdoenzyme membrane anchor subunit [Fodinibius saliphilus]|uniref:DmsC/YnfH family molybdoenzyme membrane anchor subunit n=1 Tax=Fodinibius saliphilus TaxID=1920650 RepID=UPI0011088E5D|nr:DmsC/YnfH family molybdoenzyme membrane anchor subunit [Fodinibius saliphilus]